VGCHPERPACRRYNSLNPPSHRNVGLGEL